MYDRFARNPLPVFVTLFAATLLTVLSAQAPAPKTTKERVYSAPQAARGEQTYMSTCVSCHPPATYKGAVFLNWQGRSLGDLLAFLSEKMPKNDPGSLSAKEYTQVMAFLLKINGMPAGRVDLPADPAALRGITINLLPDKLQPSHRP
jgi:S-disulfanyl-L-cysteine oxidoreductase SoxD